jgi:UDP-N-acetyl-D-mannosaminuronic acid dehydrogenase
LYSLFVKGEIVRTDATTAEMVKLMENTYRDINIAIANEFSRLADRFGIDIWEAIAIANRHPRVKILNPGPGVGGHCISVDPWFLVEAAPDITPLIKTARQVNDDQPSKVVAWMKAREGDLKEKKIVVLGLSYKPDVDDFRESPAVEVTHLLMREGADVRAYDPYACGESFRDIPLCHDFDSMTDTVDLMVLLVGHQVIKAVSPDFFTRWKNKPVLFDTANLWGGSDWKRSGLKIHRLGVNKSKKG